MTKDELLKLVTVLQAELEATNKQVEILSDVLAESRREVAAIKQARSAPVQEPVVFFDWYDNAHWGNEDFKEGCHRAWNAAIKYTTPPAAQPAPEVCCGEYKTCLKPCTPRGEFLAAQRQWVGLTDEERTEIRREHYARTLPLMDAVEAKLRSKNNG